jgi:hypothetical protein
MFSLDNLQQMLGGGAVQQISQKVGADEGQTAGVIQAALPLLLGAMARNAASPEGAQSLAGALDRDHDGSILDNVMGFFGSGDTSQGAGILGHVFGQKQETVQNELGNRFGLSAGQVGQILMMLAPVVLGMLGRTKQQQGLDAGGLSGMLAEQSVNAQQASGMMGMLNNLLDRDGDGTAMDDIAGMVGGMFRR